MRYLNFMDQLIIEPTAIVPRVSCKEYLVKELLGESLENLQVKERGILIVEYSSGIKFEYTGDALGRILELRGFEGFGPLCSAHLVRVPYVNYCLDDLRKFFKTRLVGPYDSFIENVDFDEFMEWFNLRVSEKLRIGPSSYSFATSTIKTLVPEIDPRPLALGVEEQNFEVYRRNLRVKARAERDAIEAQFLSKKGTL